MSARRNGAAAAADDRGIIITRVLGAPRELVWQAMTDPAHEVTFEECDGRMQVTSRTQFASSVDHDAFMTTEMSEGRAQS